MWYYLGVNLKAHGLRFDKIQNSNSRPQIKSFLHVCLLFNYSLNSPRIHSKANVTELPVLRWQIFFPKYIVAFNFMCSTSGNSGLLHTHITNQKIHIYNYVKLNIIIFHQHVSVTLVIIISVFYKQNTINIKIIVKNSIIKLLNSRL